MSTIKVNRLKESYVSMFPGTLDHVKLITEHFGRILSLEPVVTEDDKIEYYISYEGDINEVNEMEDFMKNVALNNTPDLLGCLKETETKILEANDLVYPEIFQLDHDELYTMKKIVDNLSNIAATYSKLASSQIETLCIMSKLDK